MTNTAPSNFKLFLNRIPTSNLKNCVFVPVYQDKKFPDVPYGTKIKLDNGLINPVVKIDVKTCILRLKSSKNIAIYAMPKGLMFLDVDVENGKIKVSDDFLKSIPETFTVITRNGGFQFYFLNNRDGCNQDIFENDINIGELRHNWQYVVGVGSYVEPDQNNAGGDGTYRVLHDFPIVEMPTEFLNQLKTMKGKEEKEKGSIKPVRKLKMPVMTKEEYIKQRNESGKIYGRLIK